MRRAGGNAYRVFLLGSWASGDAHERSDIDIAIAGPARVDPAAMLDIREACDRLPTLYTIDLVDLALVTPEFRARALRDALELEPSDAARR